MQLEPPTTSALDEETARAELYGLLAPVLYAPAASELIAGLRLAPTDAPAAGGFLEEPWRALVGAARALDDAHIVAEYDALFGGVGKPEVSLYASFYLTGFLNEKPLAALRTDLARLGLARDEAMFETEDHVAYLFEVMRYLIAGGDAGVSNLAQQRAFYSAHIQPWLDRLCDAIEAHPKAQFYAAVAILVRAFAQVEAQGFDLLD